MRRTSGAVTTARMWQQWLQPLLQAVGSCQTASASPSAINASIAAQTLSLFDAHAEFHADAGARGFGELMPTAFR